MPNDIDIYWLRRHLHDEILDRIKMGCTDYNSFSDFESGVGLVLASITDITGVNFGNRLIKDPDNHYHIGSMLN